MCHLNAGHDNDAV